MLDQESQYNIEENIKKVIEKISKNLTPVENLETEIQISELEKIYYKKLFSKLNDNDDKDIFDPSVNHKCKFI